MPIRFAVTDSPSSRPFWHMVQIASCAVVFIEFFLTQNTDLGIAKNLPCQTLESGFETCPLYGQIAYKGTVPYRNHDSQRT